MITLSAFNPVTLSASASAVMVSGVLGRILVAVNAMSLFCLLRHDAVASENIRSLRHSFKMFRVYAAFISAQMVKYKTRRHAAFRKLVREAVGSNGFAPIAAIEAVTERIFRALPHPTGFCFLNLFPKPGIFHVGVCTVTRLGGQV